MVIEGVEVFYYFLLSFGIINELFRNHSGHKKIGEWISEVGEFIAQNANSAKFAY